MKAVWLKTMIREVHVQAMIGRGRRMVLKKMCLTGRMWMGEAPSQAHEGAMAMTRCGLVLGKR